MKSAIIKKEILLLEEKLKILIQSGDMTMDEFCEKTDSKYPWVCDWKNGKLKKSNGDPRGASRDKILDMASKLGM